MRAVQGHFLVFDCFVRLCCMGLGGAIQHELGVTKISWSFKDLFVFFRVSGIAIMFGLSGQKNKHTLLQSPKKDHICLPSDQ